MKNTLLNRIDPYVLITIFFVVSRFFYLGVLGVRFDASPLEYFWQFIDVELLTNDLWRSIFYLHQQPPLFNLFLGTFIKLFGAYRDLAFQISFLIMGIVMAFSLFALMEELRVKRYIALILTIATTITPATIAYENWLFYEYPTAMLVCLCTLSLCRLMKTPTRAHATLFFLWMTLLFFTRNIFQHVWVFAWIAIVIWCLRSHWKMLCKTALPFVIIILAFMGKQYILFGSFGTSQVYTGLNLAGRIAPYTSHDIADHLLKTQQVPSFFFIDTHKVFHDPSNYTPAIQSRDAPAFDQIRKSNGHRNMNYAGNLHLGKVYTQGFLKVISIYPQAYFQSFGSTMQYFNSTLNDWGIKQNKATLTPLLPYYLPLCCGQTHLTSTGWTLIFLLPTLIIFACVVIFVRYRTQRNKPGQYIPLVFMTTTILYVSLVTVGISLGDFSRYRFVIDALYLTLLGIMMSYLIDLFKKMKSLSLTY